MTSVLRRREALASLAASLGPISWLSGCASPPVAPAAVNTDPIKVPLVMPEPRDASLASLVLIGDSTVRNGRDDGQGLGAVGQWGWGHVIERLLDTRRVNVVNRAIGGLSSRTYRTGGHWDRTRAFIKRGDVVVMQFGHNDSSPVNDNSRARGTLRGTGPESETIDNLLTKQRETVYSYGAYLRGYVAEIRALGATPVICSPIPRKRFDEQGRAVRSAASYAGWAAAVAREEGVAFIDLDTLVCDAYDVLGPVVVDQLFPRTTPEERVHTNWSGATLNAKIVAAQLSGQKLLPDQAHLPITLAAVSNLNPRLPTLFLLGDSTVRSGGQNGGQWGWGEHLSPWLDASRIQLANHAMAGRSSRTYLREGRWTTVRAHLKPGDVVLIQFGHNDVARVGDPAGKNRGSLPGTGPETQDETLADGSRETVLTYGAYIRRYVREALDAGAVPVVIAPVPHKDRWADKRDFEEHAAWGREVAQQEGALFIDLTLRVTEAYRKLGAAEVEKLFADPRTHTNEAGAKLNAACLAAGLRELPQALLEPAVRERL
jgi:lysophospholipase L1-like esterase